MRILAIGDPHGRIDLLRKIPKKKIDLILLTGDLGKADLARTMAFENIERKKKGLPEKEFTSRQQKKAFMEAYISSIKIIKYLAKFAPVLTIYGNVESSNAETKKYSKEIGLRLPLLTDDLNKIKNVWVINNKLVNFSGVRIGGLEYFVDANWILEFKPDNYKSKMRVAKKQIEKVRKILRGFAKNKIDILVCHQPPYKILDKVAFKEAPKNWQGKHAGSKVILNFIKTNQPRYVFCGHIHEGKGKSKIGKTEVYNLGVCGWKIVEFC